MNFYLVKQFPILPPNVYSDDDFLYIIPRTFELIYTAKDLQPFAEDLWNESGIELRKKYQERGFNAQTMLPFPWNEERRDVLRAELDAYYARLYGLTWDELRYILDPQDVYGPDFPGETFRVLKDNEIAKYGEYRTRRLILEAWDRLESELGPVDSAHLKSYVSSKTVIKATPDNKSSGNTAAKSSVVPPKFGEGNPRSTQATLFPKDEGSPQPSLFTSTSEASTQATPSSKQKSSLNTQTKTETKPASSAQKTIDPKASASAANPYPASENYKLFKCSVCGRMIAGFSRPAHEKSHPGRKVEWKKM